MSDLSKHYLSAALNTNTAEDVLIVIGKLKHALSMTMVT